MLIQCLLDISFCADIYSVFVVYCLFDVDCVWACAFYSHVSVCVKTQQTVTEMPLL